MRAASAGTVGHVVTLPGRGTSVVIEHANRLVTVYAHLTGIRVKAGAPVRRGAVIGSVAGSGGQKEPTLYFEVRSRSIPRNPLFLLKPKT